MSASKDLSLPLSLVIKNNKTNEDDEKKFVSFKKFSLEKRVTEYKNIMSKNPKNNVIPVIAERLIVPGHISLPILKKRKYLLQTNHTLKEFVDSVIKPSIGFSKDDELNLIINGKQVLLTMTLNKIFELCCPKEDVDSGKIDGFLYVEYYGSSSIASKEEEKKYVPFKTLHTLEERKEKSTELRKNFPKKIPVVIERIDTRGSEKLPLLKNREQQIGADMTLGEFVKTILRPSIKLQPDQALIVFIENELPAMSMMMSQLYHQYGEGVDRDGYLYISYIGQSTFGAHL